jgi:hypothetical protein
MVAWLLGQFEVLKINSGVGWAELAKPNTADFLMTITIQQICV